MDPIFLNRMKDILKNEYDDFIESLNKPSLKAIYLNNKKENILNYLNLNFLSKHPI